MYDDCCGKTFPLVQVETAGDKYLVASGLPERNTTHAKNIALLALDMMDIAKDIRIGRDSVRVRQTVCLNQERAKMKIVFQFFVVNPQIIDCVFLHSFNFAV